VGLASVGKDSEGVQFFITHTYTQNLDGRYTIFAEVVQGMNIVNQLVVGDVILKVERMR
jgi:cyclophilin family peptidyl-prolyl cis-trans isomerase